jgi:Na+/H+-translocating membrane pyrophosphatase
MTDVSHLKTLLETHDDELENDEDGNKLTDETIMKTIHFCGDKITEGAISFLAREYLYLGIFSGLFAVILGLTVDM